jgi:hypothetical protein
MRAGQSAHVHQAEVLQHMQVREGRASGAHLRARPGLCAMHNPPACAAGPRRGRAREPDVARRRAARAVHARAPFQAKRPTQPRMTLPHPCPGRAAGTGCLRERLLADGERRQAHPQAVRDGSEMLKARAERAAGAMAGARTSPASHT